MLDGFCACGFADAAPRAWEILNLHVLPALHGRGIGSRLFDAALDLGREQGATALVLWVVETNDPARRFYERRGMQPDGRRQTHDVGAHASLTEVRYRRAL